MKAGTAPNLEPADADGLVFITLPLCPKCHGKKLKTYKSIRNGDGSLTRYTFCRDSQCGHRFKVVAEYELPFE